MNLRIANDVPVVMLTHALVSAGFELRNTPEGLVLQLSDTYVRDGECGGRFVPEFLRYPLLRGFYCPDF